ncbi:hypothetical protein ACFSVM_04280 [Paenibacillus shunpengii]|uniref:Uncharacterized protein n=1 Tax=Paenibacillus shunpengii TaxID=2054424 RepID=A0ABW5SJV7_9BACL|nr:MULTISPECIES: hypothetical protein [unclassified Paenibacillus]OMC71666.1 hypothetical protein BK126_06230 [Paenibacillus sp. FSL H7-0326]SDW34060.1 hypothetical protein SAMN05518848_1011066 [Paenibacillus sp. PDC88]
MKAYSRIAVLLLYNFLLTLLTYYWLRLLSWLIEGYVPPLLVIASLLLMLFAWIPANLLLIRKLKLRLSHALLWIGFVILILLYEPMMMPQYKQSVNHHAMLQSFDILLYFKK